MYRHVAPWIVAFSSFCSAPVAASWPPPVDLSEIDQEAHNAQVVIDTHGNATAVWSASVGGYSVIQASVKPFGGAWPTTPSTISSTNHNSSTPQLAADGQGNITAVWTGSDGTYTIIQSSTKPFGGSWQVPQNVSLSGEDADTPQIAVDPSGNATAVWRETIGVSYGIKASTKLFGQGWQATPEWISTDAIAQSPQIAVDPNGNVVCVFLYVFEDTSTIGSATKLFGEAWQYDIPLPLRNSYASPQVGIDENGTATVVWSGSGEHDEDLHVFASTKSLTGSWQTAQQLSLGSVVSTSPQIAVNARGDAVVVWRAQQSPDIIQASMRLAGQGWQLSPDDLFTTSFQAENPQVAIDPYGNAIAVWMWQGTEGGPQIIQSSTKLSGQAWQGTPDNVSSTEGEGHYPQIALDSHGLATAVWEWYDGDNWFVQSSSISFGPTVTGISPKSGPEAGGTSVTITGTNFDEVSSVAFGSTPAASFSVESDTTIIAVAPPGAGTVDVTVTALLIPSQSSTNDEYSYISPSKIKKFHGKGKAKGKKLFLKTKWKKSSAINVYQYEIFAWSEKKATVFAWDKPKATLRLHHHPKHHLSKHYRKYLHRKYTIRVVDTLGGISSPAAVHVQSHVQH